MKNSIKIFAATLVLFNCYFTQVAARAFAMSIIPVTIVKNVDMNFGNIAVPAKHGVTIVLDPAGMHKAGDAAKFTVTGQPDYIYAITLPVSCILTDAENHTMTVNNFTSVPSATGYINTSGSQVLQVGATLNVGAGQTAGIYTNATAVPVTVNYN